MTRQARPPGSCSCTLPKLNSSLDPGPQACYWSSLRLKLHEPPTGPPLHPCQRLPAALQASGAYVPNGRAAAAARDDSDTDTDDDGMLIKQARSAMQQQSVGRASSTRKWGLPGLPAHPTCSAGEADMHRAVMGGPCHIAVHLDARCAWRLKAWHAQPLALANQRGLQPQLTAHTSQRLAAPCP